MELTKEEKERRKILNGLAKRTELSLKHYESGLKMKCECGAEMELIDTEWGLVRNVRIYECPKCSSIKRDVEVKV